MSNGASGDVGAEAVAGASVLEETSVQSEEGTHDAPNVGEILKRFRLRRGESLRDVAHGTGLSPSFLSVLERGESDITLGRLAAIAEHFGHDIGSLLGYSARGARPHVIRRDDRIAVDRGPGVDYHVLRIPSAELELVIATFDPHAGFHDELSHEGIDIVLILQGRVVVTINAADYTLEEGEAAVWSGGYRHRVRNDEDEKALLVGIVTERVY
jgi:transcriptional regulator with XRE-family HTH domain